MQILHYGPLYLDKSYAISSYKYSFYSERMAMLNLTFIRLYADFIKGQEFRDIISHFKVYK